MNTAAKRLKLELAQWTGFPHSVFVHSGSAALKLAIEIIGLKNARIGLPALACWTLTGAVQHSGAIPIWGDVDDCLRLTTAPTGAQAIIYMSPWGDAVGWSRFSSFSGPKIIDLTLCPRGGTPGEAVKSFDAAILSLGNGKPWNIGAGGVLLLKDIEMQRAADIRLNYGRRRSQWVFETDRYVFSWHLFEPALQAWDSLEATAIEGAIQRRAWADICTETRLPIRPLSLDPSTPPGASALTPHLLTENFVLTGQDLCYAALAEGLPILEQPVSPAYAEPAAGHTKAYCPYADALAKRLVFIPTSIMNHALATRLAPFFERLQTAPELFQRPYAIDALRANIPEEHRGWLGESLLTRRLNGEFCIYDPYTHRRFTAGDDVASALQDLFFLPQTVRS